MSDESGPSWGTRVLAILVLAVAGWILLHVVLSVLSAVVSLVVIVAAVIAVIWAYRTLST
ncbi:MAG TPA: hypothetical protein VHB30_06760 [Solirubrobacteraceae bacterium]|jgi:hypothetical protein|nr:hypothetical protein [Solirubrobacteraceae bacterium]